MARVYACEDDSREYPLEPEYIGPRTSCPLVLSEAPALDLSKLKVHTQLVPAQRRRSLPEVKGPADVWALLRKEYALADQEFMLSLLLDARHRVVGIQEIGKGGASGVEVHPADVIKGAILSGARAIILAHNHPSGEETPSAADVALTRRLWDAAELMGVKVLDHVVIGETGYYSFADHLDLGHVQG